MRAITVVPGQQGSVALMDVPEPPPGTSSSASCAGPTPSPARPARRGLGHVHQREVHRAGIKARHGYASERYRIHPGYLVAVDPALDLLGVLLEPATVVAKAWDHIEKIGGRSTWAPGKVLITGAGPIGLLAALLSVQRGHDTYVVDVVAEGRKPETVRGLGASYFHVGDLGEAAAEADIIIECSGVLQGLLEVGPPAR
jgi:threonine dehydrogenase-like Zn-dependent dehydrogenase